MPRKPRSKSPTGYFHVTLRGNGGQLLFDGDEDRIALLHILDAILPKHNIELIAWCLMGNHIHLLIDDPDDRKSDAMHAIAVSFAGRYNARMGHIGHVFQERFWDSPIKSEEYLLEAIRYIHLNPQKAGLVAYDEYPWSSHREYLIEHQVTAAYHRQGYRRIIPDTSLIPSTHGKLAVASLSPQRNSQGTRGRFMRIWHGNRAECRRMRPYGT